MFVGAQRSSSRSAAPGMAMLAFFASGAMLPSACAADTLSAKPQVMLGTAATLRVDGVVVRTSDRIIKQGVPFVVSHGHGAARWQFVGKAASLGDGTIALDAAIRCGGSVTAKPRLIVREGEPASFDAKGDACVGNGKRLEANVWLVVPVEHGSPGEVDAPSGVVTLRVWVDENGKPKSVKLAKKPSKAARPYVKAVMEAVMTWTFKPNVQDGKPVAGWVIVPAIVN